MSTPYILMQNSFHSQFQSKITLDADLEKQFLLSAIGDFSLDLYELTWDSVNEEILEDLKQTEINLLGKLMYKYYLYRERDKVLKLNNIIGKDVRLTGMADSKGHINKTIESLNGEISEIINKMKTNSFYE